MAGSNTLESVARAGFGARGIVYMLVGGLALMAAIGSGGQTGGSRSALQSLLAQPFGKVWLGLIAAGLAAFALWSIIEALTDADRHGTGWKGLGIRAVHLVSGGIYVSLALFALSLAMGWGAGGGGEDQAAKDWTAWLLAKPFGRWLVGAIGAGVVAAGFGFIWKGWRGNVDPRLAVPADKAHFAQTLGRAGFAARGVVFALIGAFLLLAAWHSRSSDVEGLGGALEALQAQPYGWVLLGITAAGLFCFGLFGLVQARYRHISAPDLDDATALAAQGLRKIG